MNLILLLNVLSTSFEMVGLCSITTLFWLLIDQSGMELVRMQYIHYIFNKFI